MGYQLWHGLPVRSGLMTYDGKRSGSMLHGTQLDCDLFFADGTCTNREPIANISEKSSAKSLAKVYTKDHEDINPRDTMQIANTRAGGHHGGSEVGRRGGQGNGVRRVNDSSYKHVVPPAWYGTGHSDIRRRAILSTIRRPHPRLTSIPEAACVTFDLDAEMEGPTQQATQPVEDPRTLGKHLSDISSHDAADVICLLHAQTLGSQHAMQATMVHGPQHVLQNDDLEGLQEDDLILPQYQETRDLALRMSSTVKSPKDGFVFGRNPMQCDVLLTMNSNEKLVSNRHFKIYVNSHGSLMLQDLSTNGTCVDNDLLRARAREGMRKPATRALNNGSIISLVSSPHKSEIKFLVRIPSRQDQDEVYEQKMRRYLEARGLTPHFSSMRESSYGNFWNGGSDYNFTGNLGKGAFATVYRVQTKREGHLYAAKEIDKRRFIKNGILDIKFDNELKIMQNLKHPNIVEYIDCKHHEHWIYIIMEFISHGELSHELRTRDILPEAEVQQITRQMMHALRYLHRRGITHRDIKPDNILIASRNPFIVKLSDFGLSKCVSDQETFLKTFCGTLLYCAPEVYPDYSSYSLGLQPKRRRSGDPSPKPSPYDESVDMWSFGAVIFHLLAGKAPIVGRGDDRGAQMLNNIMTKDIDFTPLRDQNISEDGINLVSLLLNRNPHKRPKETVCLVHAWLRDVPDVLEYIDEGPSPDVFRRALEAVEEMDEDNLDVVMIQELEQLTQPQAKPGIADSLSPLRPTKKRRTSNDPEDAKPDITYPALPTHELGSSPITAPPPQGRLFGEIDPAAMRSSGVFGNELPSIADTGMPEIRHGVECISVNDFQSMDEEPSLVAADVSGQPLVYPQTLEVPEENPPGSAPSLLGAEAQIGQLNVASPEDRGFAATTPETTNPVTPRTRELSPSSSISKSAESQRPASQQGELGRFSRTVDLNLINDEAAYAAEVAAREASRAAIKRRAETFQVPQQSRHMPSVEFARTIDAGTGQEVRREPLVERNDNLQQWMVTLDAPRSSEGFAKPPRRYGKLTSTPDSYVNVSIPLEQCDTFWGRDRACNVRYPDPQDTKIPKWALKVLFWAEGLDRFVKSGGDWTTYPGIYTIIATSASKGILVNGVKLTQRSEDGLAGLYGRLYRGDVVTIYEQNGDPDLLKFNVDILFGTGASARPAAEKPFKILKEEKRSKRYFENVSLRQSMTANPGEGARASTNGGKVREGKNGNGGSSTGPSVPVLEGEQVF